MKWYLNDESEQQQKRKTTLTALFIFLLLSIACWTFYPSSETPSFKSVNPQASQPNMSKAISAAEVAKHKSADDAWVIIEGNVYDVTEFLDIHPGGAAVLRKACGKDSTEMFWQFHNKKILEKTAKQYLKAPVQEGSKL